MKKEGTVWIIETLCCETKGKNKNINDQIENKFNAFMAYATGKELHWRLFVIRTISCISITPSLRWICLMTIGFR